MHPVIMRELAAEHIKEINARAEDGHLAHQARQATVTRSGPHGYPVTGKFAQVKCC